MFIKISDEHITSQDKFKETTLVTEKYQTIIRTISISNHNQIQQTESFVEDLCVRKTIISVPASSASSML